MRRDQYFIEFEVKLQRARREGRSCPAIYRELDSSYCAADSLTPVFKPHV
jgi:hypothetical protein